MLGPQLYRCLYALAPLLSPRSRELAGTGKWCWRRRKPLARWPAGRSRRRWLRLRCDWSWNQSWLELGRAGWAWGRGCPWCWGSKSKNYRHGKSVVTEKNESKCKLTLVSWQEDFVFSEERSERFHDDNRGLTSTAGLVNYICVITWHLTLKWSVRVFEYSMAVLCLWRNMAICKRDWHFKLENKIPFLDHFSQFIDSSNVRIQTWGLITSME